MTKRRGISVLLQWTVTALLLLVPFSASNAQTKSPYDVGHVKEPRLFAEGVISTEDDEQGGTFSPDGSEFYFVKQSQYTYFPRYGLICVSHFRDGKWSEPEAVPFSGKSLDFPPKFSPDGKTMYFGSYRQVPEKARGVLRIWAVDRTPSGWSEPRLLPSPVNMEDSANFGPSVANDGTLYFVSTRGGENTHIFRSRYANGVYAEPEKLGPEINSEFNESEPYISPDGKFLIFASAGIFPGDQDRPETLHGGGLLYARADLYLSENRGGKWTKARHLEHGINSTADESAPSLTPDGKYLFFTSERSGFTIPTPYKLETPEFESILHSTLNGHGNIFFISSDALDLSGAETAK